MKIFNQHSTIYQNVRLNDPELFAFSNSFFYKKNFANTVFHKVNDQYRIYAPEVIGRLSKIPAFGFVEFVAETYSYLNQSETGFGFRNRSNKYYFLFKYCSLSFLSFYF